MKTMKPKLKKRNRVEYAVQVGEHGAKVRTQVHSDKRKKQEGKYPKKYLEKLLNGE